jgi:hypothetical protein
VAHRWLFGKETAAGNGSVQRVDCKEEKGEGAALTGGDRTVQRCSERSSEFIEEIADPNRSIFIFFF